MPASHSSQSQDSQCPACTSSPSIDCKFLKPGDTFLCLPWALQKLYLVSAQDTLYIMFASFPAILPPLPMNPDTLLMITHSYILLGNNFSVSMHILFHLQSKPLKGRLSVLITHLLSTAVLGHRTPKKWMNKWNFCLNLGSTLWEVVLADHFWVSSIRQLSNECLSMKMLDQPFLWETHPVDQCASLLRGTQSVYGNPGQGWAKQYEAPCL